MQTQIKSQNPLIRNSQSTQMKDIRHTPIVLCYTVIYLALFCLILPSFAFSALEFPLDIHGKGYLGSYLNSDTIRYNMDASIEVSCMFARFNAFSFFIRYRDDLDMAEQRGGVTLDPRYAHYYISLGLDYVRTPLFLSAYFVHDCVHDIDYDVEGTPVFNRFRFIVASSEFHPSLRLHTLQRFLWSLDIGFYPHWWYHGFDINAGADYQYDVIVDIIYTVWRTDHFGIDVYPTFQIAKGDTCFYHQHIARVKTYYTIQAKRFGISLDYNIVNTDPIKSPEKLWLLSLFVEF